MISCVKGKRRSPPTTADSKHTRQIDRRGAESGQQTLRRGLLQHALDAERRIHRDFPRWRGSLP
jgi:hypothetical protein